MDPDLRLVATRRALHGVAELVLAGAQYTACRRIELRVVPGGFATIDDPDLQVRGGALVSGLREVPIDGQTPRSLARAVGVATRPLDDVYSGGPGVGVDDLLVVDPASAAEIVRALGAGDAALRALAPDATPILWPEHFDVGVSVDEVNYGVSPGDDHVPEPYAYVGPWTPPEQDDFWNAPFGAARPMSTLPDADAVRAFFEDGRSRLGR